MYQINSEPLELILNSNENCNGTFLTVISNSTKKDYTFKVTKKVNKKQQKYIHIYVEMGYLNFNYLGIYWENKIVIKGGKEIETPAAKAISWILSKIEKHEKESLNKQVSFYHLGKCIKCGKTLTDKKSIEIGLGPYCRS